MTSITSMTDVVLLLVTAVVLGLLGVLAAHGRVTDSREPDWTGPAFSQRPEVRR